MRRRALVAAAAVAALALAAALLFRSSHRLPAPPAPPAKSDLAGDPLPAFAVARMGSARRIVATSGLAFSADGKVLRCGGPDGVARDVDLATGATLRERPVGGGFVEDGSRNGMSRSGLRRLIDSMFDSAPALHADLPWSMPLSADGRSLAALGPAGVVFVRDDAVRRHRREDIGYMRPTTAALSPDGSRAAVGWQDGRIGVLTADDEPTLLASAGRDMPCGLAWSPDTSRLAVLATKTLQVVDAGKGDVLASVAITVPFTPSGVAYSPDGSRIAQASDRHALLLRDAATLAVAWETTDAERVNLGGVAFSPDGRTVAWGTTCLHLVDAADGTIRRTLDTGGVEALHVAWSPDGGRVAASCGGVVRMWDAATGEALLAPTPPGSQVLALEFSPDGARVLSASRETGVDVWDAATGALLRSLAAGRRVSEAAWSPDGVSVCCVVWSVDAKGSVLSFDAASGAQTDSLDCARPGRFVLHGERPLELRYTAKTSAPGSKEKWELADPRTGEVVRTLAGSVNGNAFSRDGRFAASTPGSPPLEFDDLVAGTKTVAKVKWSYDDGIVRVTEFSPDASFVACATDRGRLFVVRRADGSREFETRTELHDSITSLAVSSDGRLLAAGDAFGAIHLWSIEGDAEFPPLLGHRGPVWSLDLSPDGTRLASGGADATILVWDVSGFRPSR